MLYVIIFATGISGSGRLEYLKDVAEVSDGRIDIVDIGDLMFTKSEQLGIEIPEGKILDLDPFALNYLRAVTFEEILRMSPKYRGDSDKDLILSTHTCFRWKKHLMPAFNFYYLNRIDPDMYVNILDNAHFTWARLSRSQWRNRLTLKDILVWRDEETFITEMLAEYRRKPFYIIARKEPPELLRDLIYRVERPRLLGKPRETLRAYLSYPITYMRGDAGWMGKKDEVKRKLRSAGVLVYDPISIEEAYIVGLAENAKERGYDCVEFEVEGERVSIPVNQVEGARDDIIDQIVARDYKLIDQSDVIIVFYPVETLSPGVLSEIHYGFTHNKEVYAIFPHEAVSPFFEYYTTAVFRDVEELIAFLKEMNKV